MDFRSSAWRSLPLAGLVLLATCAAPPPEEHQEVRMTAREQAEQVGRDVGAIVEGMRRAHGLD